MADKTVKLVIESKFYKKIDDKRKKLGYENIQQYFLAIARRDIFRKKSSNDFSKKFKAANVFSMKKVLTPKGKPFSV